MVQILVRNIEADVIGRLRRKAEAHAVSLECFVRGLLEEAARPAREELLVEIDAIRRRSRPGALMAEGGIDLIREARGEPLDPAAPRRP